MHWGAIQFLLISFVTHSMKPNNHWRRHMPIVKFSLSIATVAGAAAAAILATTAAEATPRSYQLICKGGGEMVATIKPTGKIALRFAAGTEAGTARSGQCTWVDRGFRVGEPNVLSLTGDHEGTTYILRKMLSGDRFYVQVYNDNNGRMVVTRTGL